MTKHSTQFKVFRLVCALGLCALVAGCQTYDDRPFFDPLNLQMEMTPREEKAVITVPTEHSFVLRFPQQSADPSEDDRRAAIAFLSRRAAEPSDEVYLDFGLLNETTEIADERRMSLAAIIASAGLEPGHVRVRNNVRGIAENEVNLTVKRYLVTLPGCPDYTSRAGRTFDNRPHSNWGCATATNLGQMIAEPRDLVVGRGATPGDAEALTFSTQRYRAGETKPLDVDNSNTAEAFGASGGGGQ